MLNYLCCAASWTNGVVPHRMFPLIWKHINPSLYDKIRTILEQFEVMFPVKKGDNPFSIIPSMMNAEPEGDFKALYAQSFAPFLDGKGKKPADKKAIYRVWRFKFLPVRHCQ
jgi:hypothetical protein